MGIKLEYRMLMEEFEISWNQVVNRKGNIQSFPLKATRVDGLEHFPIIMPEHELARPSFNSADFKSRFLDAVQGNDPSYYLSSVSIVSIGIMFSFVDGDGNFQIIGPDTCKDLWIELESERGTGKDPDIYQICCVRDEDDSNTYRPSIFHCCGLMTRRITFKKGGCVLIEEALP